MHGNTLQGGWTAERIEKLKRMWADGDSAAQIANKLGGVSRSAVLGKVHRLALTARAVATRAYPSGPASYGERVRREAERAPRRAAAVRERRERKADGTLPPVQVVEPPQSTEFLGLTLGELKRGQCRFSRGDGPYLFCGQPRVWPHSYCARCYRIAYSPPQPANRKAKIYRLFGVTA